MVTAPNLLPGAPPSPALIFLLWVKMTLSTPALGRHAGPGWAGQHAQEARHRARDRPCRSARLTTREADALPVDKMWQDGPGTARGCRKEPENEASLKVQAPNHDPPESGQTWKSKQFSFSQSHFYLDCRSLATDRILTDRPSWAIPEGLQIALLLAKDRAVRV